MLKKQKGYLMIEILVSLVIFSIAIVSLVSLQINSYSSVQDSSLRNIAVNASYELFDKMRANKDAVISGAYLGNGVDNKCKDVNFNTIHGSNNCNFSQMAQDDLKEFFDTIELSLPKGKAVICIDSSKSKGTPLLSNCDGLGNEYVVKVFWKNNITQKLNTNSGYSQVIIGTKI